MKDEEQTAVPEFGDREPGRRYEPRPGAYGLIFDGVGRIAVLQTPDGCFLPGGGTEGDESPEETLVREVREECGFAVSIGERVGEAVEYRCMAGYEFAIRKECVFFTATVAGARGLATEDDHTLIWPDLQQALAALAHGSQRWAVAAAHGLTGEVAAEGKKASGQEERAGASNLARPPPRRRHGRGTPMRQPPTGTVTFLFTDIEGSTRLWEQHPDVMPSVLARHDRIMRDAIEAGGGYVFKTVGDGVCAAFATAPAALGATLAAQSALAGEPWTLPTPLHVRMALHTGTAEERDGDYFGQPLNRVARLMAAAHGGQTLLSLATQELVRDHLPASAALRDLGDARLKDLGRSERVFQVVLPGLPADFPPLRTLESAPNNLPQQVTSFVGREKEIAEVKALLQKTRLLTLVGPGGAGKSRLSLQVAADLLDGQTDGVWLAELAALSDPALVPQAVADALGVREETGRPLLGTLADALKPKKLLLILDNAEHLISACAVLASDLLKNCPGVHILASSREPLNVAGETAYRLPSLSLPDPKRVPTVGSLSQYEAVRLFIERAQSVQPTFAVTDGNAPAVAQVCVHLDGIPLAIELAAARVRSLSVEEINARLDNRFRLLTGGSRTVLPRQQTLRALVDWSYDLLSGPEKALLARLSVFAGGWALEAAEAVCAGDGVEDWEVLDGLTSLTDKSLIVYEESRAGRYRLLETIRRYAQDRLAEDGGEGEFRGRHRDHFLGLAEEAQSRMLGQEQGVWLRRLSDEQDNMRAALDWCRADAGGAESELRLATALRSFWQVCGPISEGRARLASALAHDGVEDHPYRRVRALAAAANLAYRQSDLEATRSLAGEMLPLSETLEDTRGTANALLMLGNVALMRDEMAEARAYYERCLELYREVGDQSSVVNVLSNLGLILEGQGDLAGAEAVTLESLHHFRAQGDTEGTAYALSRLGALSWRAGEAASARAHLERSLAAYREIGARSGDLAFTLILLAEACLSLGEEADAARSLAEALAVGEESGDRRAVASALQTSADLCLAEERWEAASRLLGAVATLRETVGIPLTPPDRVRIAQATTRAQAGMSAPDFAASWGAGQSLPWEQAVDEALAVLNDRGPST